MLTPAQIKKLEKLAKVGDIAVADELNVLEEKVSALEEIVPQLREAKDGEDGYTPVKGVDYFDGKDGYTPVKGVDYFDGVPGRDGRDGKDSTVPGPKGETGPIGPQGIPGIDGKDGFVDEATVAYLEDEVKKAQLDREAYDRALGIVDQRTSFLINKASNLESNKINGVGVRTITVSTTAPANPTAGDIWIDTDAYAYKAVTSTYSITSEDYFLGCSGTFTITLPTAVSFTGEYIIKNTGDGVITVVTTGSQTIDGVTEFFLIADEVITLRSTNSNWLIV